MTKQACVQCGSDKIRVTRENEPMGDVMPNVVLQDVEVRKCLSCGDREIVIPRMNDLMSAVADAIVRKPGRLTGEEVRFVRTHFDLDGVSFAELVDTTPSTVSRWENNRTPVGNTADLLMRALVLLNSGRAMPVEKFRELSEQREAASPKPGKYVLAFDGAQWRATSGTGGVTITYKRPQVTVPKAASSRPVAKRKATKAVH